jgi:glycosyltransferase involved in cell wall biosynthesis
MSVYNGQRFVAEAIESILAQTFADFEFLIIDDGSKDESPAIVRRYEQKDKRVNFLSRRNKGLTKTLNEMLAMSRGQFLARMDCDDVALPDRFALQAQALRDDPGLACVGGNFQLIDGEGRLLTTLRPPPDDATIQKQALAGHGAICHPAAMIRRESLLQINGYDEEFKIAQDLDLWLRLGEVGKLANVPHTVLKFRLHEGSVSETKRVEQRKFAKMACERAWQRRGITGTFEAEEPWRPGNDAASKMEYALRYGWWAFNSGQRRTAAHYARLAIKAMPLRPAGWKLLLAAAVKPLKPAEA